MRRSMAFLYNYLPSPYLCALHLYLQAGKDISTIYPTYTSYSIATLVAISGYGKSFANQDLWLYPNT